MGRCCKWVRVAWVVLFQNTTTSRFERIVVDVSTVSSCGHCTLHSWGFQTVLLEYVIEFHWVKQFLLYRSQFSLVECITSKFVVSRSSCRSSISPPFRIVDWFDCLSPVEYCTVTVGSRLEHLLTFTIGVKLDSLLQRRHCFIRMNELSVFMTFRNICGPIKSTTKIPCPLLSCSWSELLGQRFQKLCVLSQLGEILLFDTELSREHILSLIHRNGLSPL